jgi:transposase InsO family protein
MSLARVAVLQVVAGQLSVVDSAAKHGFSRRHLHRLLAAYREGGLEALEPRSRRPKTNPAQTSKAVRGRVIELRSQLTADGLDAGPVTIAWHLRFEMAQPNEMWQSDFIHWLDDHSRYLLSATVHQPVTGDAVVTVFLDLIEQHGIPASTLTDNGSVYTSRFTGGRNAFEYVLALLGVRQKNGAPGHPQTQGKTERFHQTCSAGSRPGHPPPAPRNSKSNSTSSASTTTSAVLTAPCTAELPATPTAPPPRQLPRAHPPKRTTACATTDSTPKAR